MTLRDSFGTAVVAVAVLAGVALIIFASSSTVKFTAPAPKPKVPFKTYTLTVPGLGQVQVQGSRIDVKDGCGVLYREDVLDTIVCVPHTFTEANEAMPEPQVSEPKPVEPSRVEPDGSLIVEG